MLYGLDLLYSCWLFLLFSLVVDPLSYESHVVFGIYPNLGREILHWFPEEVFMRGNMWNLGCMRVVIQLWCLNGNLARYGIIVWKLSWVLEALFHCLLASPVLVRCLVPFWLLLVWTKLIFLSKAFGIFLHVISSCYEIAGWWFLVWDVSVFIHVLCTQWTLSAWKLIPCSSRTFYRYIWIFLALCFSLFSFSVLFFFIQMLSLLDQSSNFFSFLPSFLFYCLIFCLPEISSTFC